MTHSISAADLLQRAWSTSEKLKSSNIQHQIVSYRDDALSITARSMVGHWEIDFFADGKIQFEIFETSGIDEVSFLEIDEIIKDEINLRADFFNSKTTTLNQE